MRPSTLSVPILFMDRLKFIMILTSGIFHQILENSVENSAIFIQKAYVEFCITYCKCPFHAEEFTYFVESSRYLTECTVRVVVW